MNFIYFALLIITATYSGAFDKTTSESSKKDKFFKSIGIILFIISLLFFSKNLEFNKITSNNFNSNINSNSSYSKSYDISLLNNSKFDKPVLIDFWATWCTVCKKLDKEVLQDQSVQNILNEKFIFLKVDVDKNPEIIKMFNLKASGVPILLILDKNKNIVFQNIGMIEKDKLISELNKQ